MGQSAGREPAAAAVDRAGFSEEEYGALRTALRVAEDSPNERVDLPAFLACFKPHMRPLVQPVFFQLARSQAGDPSASWPVLVAGLASLVRGGADWPKLLEAWSAGSTRVSQDDAELYVELAVSLCFWCSLPGVKPATGGVGDASGAGAGADGADAYSGALDIAVAALRPPSPAAPAAEAAEAAETAAAAVELRAVVEHLKVSSPYLPHAVAPCFASALLRAPAPTAPPVPESRILDAGLTFLLRGMEARLWESDCDWRPLYRDWRDGRSFNGLLKGALHYDGPAVLLIRTSENQVIGAVSTSWSDGNGKFTGRPECFLFSLAPSLRVLRSASRSGNYVYLNASNKFAPRGLGFGGQLDFYRLWLDADFDACYAMESDATYASGALLQAAGLQAKFEASHIEIWGFGGAEAAAAQAAQRERVEGQREQARKVDRAKLADNEFDREMFLGGTFKGSAESREVVERPVREDGD